MGSWEQIDRWHFYRNHYGCLYSNGMVIGYFNETETDVLAPDGNSYTGSNSTTQYKMDGSVIAADIPGVAQATRIAP